MRLAENLKLTVSVFQLEGRKASLEIDLYEDLKRRREGLKAQIEGDSSESPSGLHAAAIREADLESRKLEISRIKSRLATCEQKMTTAAKQVEELSTQLRDSEQRLESVRVGQSELSRQMGKQQKSIERYLGKKQRLAAQREKCNKSICDLGVLPEEAFDNDKYAKLQSDKVRQSSARTMPLALTLSSFS